MEKGNSTSDSVWGKLKGWFLGYFTDELRLWVLQPLLLNDLCGSCVVVQSQQAVYEPIRDPTGTTAAPDGGPETTHRVLILALQIQQSTQEIVSLRLRTA